MALFRETGHKHSNHVVCKPADWEAFGGAVRCTHKKVNGTDVRVWETTTTAKMTAVVSLIVTVSIYASSARGMAKRYNRAYNPDRDCVTCSGGAMTVGEFALWTLENVINMITANLYGFFLDFA